MSNLFKTKKQELPSPKELSTEEQKQARGILSQYAGYGSSARAPSAYTGLLSAEPQAYESYIAPLMESYATRETSPLYTAAQEQIQKTLTGGFDPETSDYYQSLRRGVLEEGEESKERMRQAFQIGGMLRSSPRIAQEADIESDIRTELGDIMASLAQQERQNQLSTLYPALSYTQFAEQRPLNTLQALMTAGAYQTGQEQSALDRLYQEYQRQLAEEKYPLQYALALANPNMYSYYQPQYTTQSSTFSQYIMPLIETAMIAAAMSSDIRLKKNIRKIGTFKGHNLYMWDWIRGVKDIVKNTPRIGVIAQEIMRTKPYAIIVGKCGYLMVNYSLLN